MSVNGILHSCVTLDNIFTESELQEIEFNLNRVQLSNSMVGNYKFNENIRKSNVVYIYKDEQTNWVFNKLANKIKHLNNNSYQFDLIGFDYFQYSEYTDQGHYDWHTDIYYDSNLESSGLTRKLSISIILSENTEYEGGKFEIGSKGLNNPISIEQKRNRLIAFPSFVSHRVTPVIAGKRRSIVIWVLGPSFK